MQTIQQQNNNLVERKPIEGTPFTIIKQIMDNDKPVYFLVMGDHRLTEPTQTEEQTLDKILTEHWKIITTVVAIIVEKTLELKKINTHQQIPDNLSIYENEKN